MSERIEVHVYQTGQAREKISKVKDESNKYFDLEVVKLDKTDGLPIILKHAFLSHLKEAEHESKDFSDFYKQLCNLKESGEHWKKFLDQYNLFISIGSSSSQAWQKVKNNGVFDGMFKVIVPNDNNIVFQKIGVGMKEYDNLKPLIEIIDANLTDRALMFNAIGYTSPSMQYQNKSNPLKITATENGLRLPNLPDNPVTTLEQCNSKKNKNGIDTNGVVEEFVNKTLGTPLQGKIDVFPRIQVDINGEGKDFGGSWCSSMVKESNKTNKTNKTYMVDMGGGAVYMYGPNGEKYDIFKGLKPNSLLQDPQYLQGPQDATTIKQIMTNALLPYIDNIKYKVFPHLKRHNIASNSHYRRMTHARTSTLKGGYIKTRGRKNKKNKIKILKTYKRKIKTNKRKQYKY